MTNAYLVCGPTSSGNRLLASILCRSGCTGEGSTNQPKTIDELPQAAFVPYVLIAHVRLSEWINALRARGFEVTAIVMIREPIANCLSMCRHGHNKDFEEAYRARVRTIARNIAEALAHNLRTEILTYEGLTEPFLREWLPRIGLPYVPGPLKLPGQIVPSTIQNQNSKHYYV